MQGGGMSGGVAGAVVDLMLLVRFLLFCMDPHLCVRMLPAPPVWIRLSMEATVTWGEQAGAKLAISPRAEGASHMPTARPQPAAWHPPQQELRGLQGSLEPLIWGGFWSEGVSWSVVQGCSSGDAQPRLYGDIAHPEVPEPRDTARGVQNLRRGGPGLSPLLGKPMEGVGECRALSLCLALAGGILGRSLAGSPSGCCSTLKTPEGPSWSGRARPRRVSGAGRGQPGGAPRRGAGGHPRGDPGPLGHSAQPRFPQLRCTGREKEKRVVPSRQEPTFGVAERCPSARAASWGLPCPCRSPESRC